MNWQRYSLPGLEIFESQASRQVGIFGPETNESVFIICMSILVDTVPHGWPTLVWWCRSASALNHRCEFASFHTRGRFNFFGWSRTCVSVSPLRIPLGRCVFVLSHPSERSAPFHIAIWLILPVVICLSQRLSHACLSTNYFTAKPRMAH